MIKILKLRWYNMNKLNAVDIFCGAGGTSEALKKYFNIVAAVEFDEIIAKSYALNHGWEHLYINDIKELNREFWDDISNNREIDLLVSTPPCQGFSKHSRKKVIEIKDPRNDLILETLRVAHIIKPNYIFMENVPNIINYKVFHKLLKSLSNIKKNGRPLNPDLPSYHIRYEIVNASDYNVPQKRTRMILIAKKIETFPYNKAYIQTRNTPNPIVNEPLDIWPKKIIAPLLGEFLSGYKLQEIKAGETGSTDSLHKSRSLSDINLQRIKSTRSNGGSRTEWAEDLVLECHKKEKISFTDVYGRMSYNDYAPTITCGCINYSKGRFGHPIEDRAISLREAALIQTFPYEYKFTGKITGELYKGSMDKIATQIGNAVPINMARLFFKAIYEANNV